MIEDEKIATLNEVSKIDSLISALMDSEINPDAALGRHVQDYWSQISSDDVMELFRCFLTIEAAILRRVLPGINQDHYLETLRSLADFFSFKNLSATYKTVMVKRGELALLQKSFRLISQVFKHADEINIAQIEDSLTSLERISRTEILDADEETRSVVAACLHLSRNAVARLKLGNVGQFQDEVLTAAGRITLQLKKKTLSGETVDTLTKVSDGILRLAGLVELGQSVAGLIGFTGDVLLLEHHSAS